VCTGNDNPSDLAGATTLLGSRESMGGPLLPEGGEEHTAKDALVGGSTFSGFTWGQVRSPA
jgi:hypothetical protein